MMRAAPDGLGLTNDSSLGGELVRVDILLGFEVSGEGGFDPPSLIARSRRCDWLSGLTSIVAPSFPLRASYLGDVSGRYMECGVALRDRDNSNSGSSAFNLWGGFGDTSSSRHCV